MGVIIAIILISSAAVILLSGACEFVQFYVRTEGFTIKTLNVVTIDKKEG